MIDSATANSLTGSTTTTNQPPQLVIDSGATSHFITTNTPTTNVRQTRLPISVLLPNGKTILSTHSGNLRLPPSTHVLPPSARTAHIFPHLKASPLLSLGQLCDHGCTAHFDRTTAVIRYNNNAILTGTRKPPGLWTVSRAPSPTPHQLNATFAFNRQTTKLSDHLSFLHAACFSPTHSTWLAATKNNQFTTWPAGTGSNIKKHLSSSQKHSKHNFSQQNHPLD